MNAANIIESPGMQEYRKTASIIRTEPQTVGGRDQEVELPPIPIQGDALFQPYTLGSSILVAEGEREKRKWLMISDKYTPIRNSDHIVDGGGMRYSVDSARNWGDHYETTLLEL